MKYEIKTNKNKSFTTFAGLEIYSKLWKKFKISSIFNSLVPKHSGAKYSKIIQNLFFRNLIDANSMSALSYIDKQEYFFNENISLNRTTYGRNLKKLNNNLRRKFLLKFNNNFISHEEINEDSILIYDTSAIKAEGKNYENTKLVYDACDEKMIHGYALNKLLLKTKKKLSIIDFDLNIDDKKILVEKFKEAKRQINVNKIVFDAGPDVRGMDFFKKLDEEDFLFYTKAVSNWIFNFGKNFNVNELKELFNHRLKKEKIISLEVWKDEMLLRLIFVFNDPRVCLTNDLTIPVEKIVKYYKWRWDIEISFREEKQNLGLKILPCWNEKGIKTHILLVLLAFVLSQIIVSKIKIVKGIKLIKRKIVKVFAFIIKKFNKLFLRFSETYLFDWIFRINF
jgi:hypothetical protein